MALNLILGRSARAAMNTLDRCQGASILCVVSPSPRAERRMSDEDLIQTFRYMGENLKSVVRMEAHFYASDLLALPAQALTAFLRKAQTLENLLLNGVRMKGSCQDIVQLGIAFLQHPNLKKVTFFNIAPLSDPSKGVGSELDLLPLLEGASRNANVTELEIRYARWANPHLTAIVSPRYSQITSLCFSGIDTLYGPVGDSKDGGFPDFMEALKNNVRLQELKICQAPGPRGTGAFVAEMLRENSHLQKLCIHLFYITDALPIADALAHENNTLTSIEIRWPDAPQQDSELFDNEARRKEIKAVQAAFETALVTNGSLVDMKVCERTVDHSTEKIKLYTRLNQAGRMEILQDEELTAEEALEFFETNSEDTDIIYHMILAKVSMLPLVIEHLKHFSVPRKLKKAPPKQPKCDSDSDDDLPIQFLASKPNSIKKNRKRAKKSKTSIQASPARTLKRRRNS